MADISVKEDISTLVPLGENVLIALDDPDSMTKGGIVLPDQAKEKPRWGTVLAVGPGKLLEDGTRSPIDLGSEDRVVVSPYGQMQVFDDNESLVVMPEGNIVLKRRVSYEQ